MGNCFSFSSEEYFNENIPLPDGNYKGYCEYCDNVRMVLDMVIILNYKKYKIICNRIKGMYWSKTFNCEFKIEDQKIVAYKRNSSQNWVFEKEKMFPIY